MEQIQFTIAAARGFRERIFGRVTNTQLLMYDAILNALEGLAEEVALLQPQEMRGSRLPDDRDAAELQDLAARGSSISVPLTEAGIAGIDDKIEAVTSGEGWPE